MKTRYAEILVILVLSVAVSALPAIYSVAAAGQLYLSPTPIPVQAAGSTFTVQVKVASLDQFNGYDIQVKYDPSVINAQSISTSGNIFAANATGGIAFQTVNCVNGTGSGCCLTNACAPLDGVGIAHSAFADTKFASGDGLLFNITFTVVSNKPFSPLTIQNDVISNGGRNGVIHTAVNGAYGQTSSLTVSKFFTDGSFNPLALDNNSNPSVNVVLAIGIVRSTDPGQILAWVNVANNGQTQVQSLTLTDTLPADWRISPAWPPAKGAIHVFYANTTSLATNPEITDPSTITTSAGNPETVALSIPNLNATGIGHPLLPGQSILLSVKLSYGLDQTSQSFASYPRTYTDTATALGYTQASYAGTQSTATGSASFIAHAKVLGDVNGDGSVDILDLGAVLLAYGSTLGSSNWNPNADFAGNGYISINDVSIAFYYYGTSS